MKRPAAEEPDDLGGGDESGDESEDEGEAAAEGGAATAGSGDRPSNVAAISRRKKSQVTLSDGRTVSVKVRNHVNPLLPHFQKPVPVPEGGNWSKVYQDVAKPVVIDLGCAKGRFCLEGARRFPEFNWLGIEIREALVVRANEWVKEEKLANLHYIFGNASAGVTDLLRSLPAGVVRRVTVQCPDPCFKKKHQKRRMVTPRLVEELAELLPAGAVVFLQSDVEQVAMQMVDTFAANGRFVRVERVPEGSGAVNPDAPIAPVTRKNATAGRDYQDKAVGGGEWEHKGVGAVEGSYRWLADNPLGLMSERESSTISRGLPMFRSLFQRCAASPESEQKAEKTPAEASQTTSA